MADKTALDLVANYQNVTVIPEQPIRRTRNVTYLCDAIDTASTVGYVEITNIDDIATYTADTLAGGFFDAGLSKIYLLFGNLTDTGLMDSAYSEIQTLTWTLIVSPELTSNPFDLNDFSGLKGNASDDLALLPTLATRISDQPFYFTVMQVITEAFITELTGAIINPINSLWSALQYQQFPAYSILIEKSSDAEQARNVGLTFAYKDKTTITTTSLFNMKAGGIAITDYYISEDVRQDIQLSQFNTIQNNSVAGKRFSYTNANINILVRAGQDVIDSYVARGMLNGGAYTIPPVSQQSQEDITMNKLSNASIELVQGENIWYIDGTINALADASSANIASTQAQKQTVNRQKFQIKKKDKK